MVKVYERVVKSVILVYEKDQKGQQMKSYGCEEIEKTLWFCHIYANSKVSAFRIVIRDIKF